MPFAVAAQTACYSFDNGSVTDQITQQVGWRTGGVNRPDRFGRANGAIHLTCGGALTLGRGQNLKPTNGTVMIWVKIPTECQAGQAPFQPIFTILAGNGTGFDAPYSLQYVYATLGERFAASAQRNFFGAPINTTSYNTWYHAALTFSDTEAKLYVDGSLQASRTKEPTRYDSLSYAYIGYRPDSHGAADIIVDEFRVYDRVLTQAEIAAIYSAPMTAVCSSITATAPLNPPKGDLVQVFPNPTTGDLHLTHQNGIALRSYSLSDISGRFVCQNENLPNANILHLAVPNGVYFLFVTDAVGAVSKHKVVVLR